MEKELVEAKERFDFVRFTFADIHGIGRCKTVPKSSFEKFFNNGTQFYVGSLGLGFKGEIEPCDKITGKQKATNFQELANLKALPVRGTLHPLYTINDGKYRVGEILCETFHCATGLRQEENPRYLARKQLDRLNKLGFELYSAFEIEFTVVEPETLKPLFYNIGEIFTYDNQTSFDSLLLDIVSEMETRGVEIETVHSEYSEGQFEIATKPQLGIKAADNLFLAKNCIKDVAKKHGLKALLMTKPALFHSCSGLHFNHSLRRINGGGGDDVYAFFDEKDKLGLSRECRWWLAGLTHHFRALNAICSPTFNCYRRVDKPWAPVQSGWGIENRMESYRVKNYSAQQTLIESRLPSISANPYLLVAATVAAGLDGIENKLPCPPPLPLSLPVDKIYTEMELTKVPLNLTEALKSLKEDDYIVKTLGKDLVEWFVLLKESEIEFLAGCDVTKEDPEMYARERDLYMNML